MSIKINIGEILSKSWKIVWKFKVLWIFGILAGCGGGNGNRFNYNGGSNGGGGSGNGNTGQIPDFLRQFQYMRPEQAIREFINQYLAIIVGVILLLCVLWFLFYFLGVMGRIGLIKGAGKADAGVESMSFGELWTEGLPFFWRMFGLNLLVGLPFFLLIVILLAGLAFAGFSAFRGDMSNAGTGVMLVGAIGVFFAFMCVISLISLVVGMIVEQAQNAIVLEDLGILESLGRGWSVFKSGFLSVVVIAIILGVIGWIIGLVMALPMIAIAVPAVIGMAAAGTKNFIVPLVIAGGCCVLYFPVLLVLSGILQSYTQSVWTLTYRRLTDLMKPVLPAQVELIEPQ
jgi:hypothetical protein